MTDAANGSAELVTRTGFAFGVRPVAPDDAARLRAFFGQVTPEDLRFRFFTMVKEVSAARLLEMTQVDHRRTENFLALAPDGETVIATALLAADDGLERGEVAIAIRPDYKQRGISWTLLDHVATVAAARGIRWLESVESRDNHAAIALEREMGFLAEPVADDPAIVLLRRRLG